MRVVRSITLKESLVTGTSRRTDHPVRNKTISIREGEAAESGQLSRKLVIKTISNELDPSSLTELRQPTDRIEASPSLGHI